MGRNPIDGICETKEGTYVSVPAPSSFQWAIEDISKDDSGRTESGKMEKAMIGQVIKIELSWQNVTDAVASEILKAFNHEYLFMKYVDPMLGSVSPTGIEFYVGNRTAPMYNSTMGLWQKISFNIISREVLQLNSGKTDWEVVSDTV